jgi:F420-non-reducing hydrogenase small subunit
MVRLLRRKSQLVIAYGACAQLGGIPGLANQFDREQILKYVYQESPSVQNAEQIYPQQRFAEDGRVATLPGLWKLVRTLDQVIPVDYYLPGCPPTAKLLQDALGALLAGNAPPKGTVLAPDTALCEECPRRDTKPTDLAFSEFKRPHQVIVDPEKCLLAQGLICMGPATRGGCGALCVKGNMPCSGCFGPTSRIKDQGAKFLSSVCSSVAATEEKAIDDILATIPDPVGTFYRYGLAGSLLRARAGKAAA